MGCAWAQLPAAGHPTPPALQRLTGCPGTRPRWCPARRGCLGDGHTDGFLGGLRSPSSGLRVPGPDWGPLRAPASVAQGSGRRLPCCPAHLLEGGFLSSRSPQAAAISHASLYGCVLAHHYCECALSGHMAGRHTRFPPLPHHGPLHVSSPLCPFTSSLLSLPMWWKRVGCGLGQRRSMKLVWEARSLCVFLASRGCTPCPFALPSSVLPRRTGSDDGQPRHPVPHSHPSGGQGLGHPKDPLPGWLSQARFFTGLYYGPTF